jgi:hypothetical protein
LAPAGCAVNGTGLIAAEVIESDGARIVETQSLGVAVRSYRHDAGLSLGYSRRVYVYPLDSLPDLEPGRYIFWTPVPEPEPTVFHAETVGGEVSATPPIWAVSLGYRSLSLLAWTPADADGIRRLRFMPDMLDRTILLHCQGEDTCAEFPP